MKRWIGYSAYALVVTIVFLVWFFPSDLLKAYVESAVTRHSNTTLSLDSASLGFPVVLHFDNAVLSLTGKPGSTVVMESIDIEPLFRTLIRGRVALAFTGEAYGGRGSGTVAFEDSFAVKGPVNAEARFENIDVGKCSYVKATLGRKMTGKVKGTLSWSGFPGRIIDGTGSADCVFFNGEVRLVENILGFDTVTYDRIDAKAILKNRTLRINPFHLIGTEVNSTVSGNIFLDNNPMRSRLSLKGQITVPALNKKAGISLSGTASNPVLRVR